jgi:AraC-like DNA-binding protein
LRRRPSVRKAGQLGKARKSSRHGAGFRGLAARGEILNQLRTNLATVYLSDRNLSISRLVGYQGVGAFSHRCKRWTGMSPKRMRDKLLANQ